MADVFVSYSQNDRETALGLTRALAERGIDVWFDNHEVRVGEDIGSRVQDAMRSASTVVLLIGSEPSSYVRREWSSALQKAWASKPDLTLVPVLLPGADPPAFLSHLHYLRLTDAGRDWDRLAASLKSSSKPEFQWHAPKLDRTGVADRLSALEQVAAALPDEPEPQP
jgi:hypothetical protein